MPEEKELTTEEKAALVGKEANGHDKEAQKEIDEPVPDYEVTEEGEEAEAKEDDGDKRLGKTREDREHKQLTNREKRQLRKKRLAQKFDAKDAVIRSQQEQINALASRLNEVDGKLSQVDQETLVQTYNNAVGTFQKAEQAMKEAFAKGDGDGHTKAMREMYLAQKQIDECAAINARNQQMKSQPRQQAPQKDPVMVNKAQAWAAENDWFKAVGQRGRDEDSEITDTVAKRLVEEGFDPRTDDYWDELTERLAARGIGNYENDEDEQQSQSQSQREKQREEKPVERRKSPPVSSSGGRGDLGAGKTRVSLPTAFITGLKEVGIWDDPKRRNKAILDYQRIRAEEKR